MVVFVIGNVEGGGGVLVCCGWNVVSELIGLVWTGVGVVVGVDWVSTAPWDCVADLQILVGTM